MDDLTFVLKGGRYTFKPLSGPLEQNPRPAIFADLGYALAAWARMEHLLTIIVIHINKKASSSILHDPDPSAKFTKLMKLYKKWHSKHPDYAHIRTPIDSVLFDGLYKQAEVRNELAHGVITHHDEQTGQFRMLLFKHVGIDTWKTSEVEYHEKALEKFASLTNLAHQHFVEIAKILFERVDPPQALSGKQ